MWLRFLLKTQKLYVLHLGIKIKSREIEKAIVSSNLGLSVAVDTIGIRVIFPQLTTETRQTLVKILKEKLEESRITVRKERERIWDEVQRIEKEGKMTEDEKFRAKRRFTESYR